MYRVVNDSVHGHYDLPKLCWAIIDTPAFQRLRNIKQLGLVYKVYPGAMHSRFEHSLGTAYLSRRMIMDLSYRSQDVKISSKDILMVTIAGLCHDLGHCAFSHSFEKFAETFSRFEVHEHMSYRILKYIYSSKMKAFNEYDIHEKEIDIIGQIIFGSKDKAPKTFKWDDNYFDDRKFFYDIVSNSETGIDVDKFDYIARDCKYANVQCTFDPRRIFEFAYIDVVNGEYRILYHSKISEDINYMWQSRSDLHRRVYRHKTVVKLDNMMIKVLNLCKDEPIIPFKSKNYRLTDIYKNIELYLRITDHILTVIFFQHPYSVNIMCAQKILNDMESRVWVL